MRLATSRKGLYNVMVVDAPDLTVVGICIRYEVKPHNGKEEFQTKRPRAKLIQTSHLNHFHLVEMPKVNFYFRHEKIGFLRQTTLRYDILKSYITSNN